MIARAWFFDRRLDVDPAAKRAVVVPTRGAGFAAAAALAVTPAALGAAHALLTPAGWVFLVVYAVAVVATLAIVLSPENRLVELSFDGRYKPFAIVKDARTFADAIASARSFEELDAAATKAGHAPQKHAIMSLALVVFPGWLFAWAALR